MRLASRLVGVLLLTATAVVAAPPLAGAMLTPGPPVSSGPVPSSAAGDSPARSATPAAPARSMAAARVGGARLVAAGLAIGGGRPPSHRGIAPAHPVAGSAALPAAWPAAVTTAGYTSLSPARILDTRIGVGAPARPLGQNATLDLLVAGRAGVPAAGVEAVVLNLTVVTPTAAAGYVTAYPGGSVRAAASNVNFTRGVIVSNLVIAEVGVGGRVTLYNSAGSTQLVADVTGYFAAAPYFTAQAPARILDTRTGNGAARARLGAGGSLVLQVAGRGGVPATGAVAVVANLTVVTPTHATYVTAYPGGVRPNASNLNVVAGQTAAVLAIATLSASGTITLYNNAGALDLIVDVAGTITAGGEYVPLPPVRILDTRTAGHGPLGPSYYQDLPLTGYADVAVTGVAAVVLSVTAVTPTANGYLAEQPWTPTYVAPTTSTVNFAPAHTTSNLVIARVGAGGWIRVLNSAGTTDVVIDVAGYFTKGGAASLATGGRVTVSVGRSGQTVVTTTPAAGVSQDGRYVAFLGTDPTLTPYLPSPLLPSVFVRDTVLGLTTEVIGLSTGDAIPAALSADGRYVLWTTAVNAVPDDANNVLDVYESDLGTGYSWLVSVDAAGTLAGDGPSGAGAAISSNGRYAVYQSSATDLVTPATTGGQVIAVDLSSVGVLATGVPVASAIAACGAGTCVSAQSVSDDGTSVGYQSAAAGSAPTDADIWHGTIGSPTPGTSTVLSSTSTGTFGNGSGVSLSRDGRYAAFASITPWAGGDDNGGNDVFLRDTRAATAALVSAAAGTTVAGDLPSQDPLLSADGSVLTFDSAATDLVTGLTVAGSVRTVYAYPVAAGPARVISQADVDAADAVPSATGAWVVYTSGGSVSPELVLTRLA